MADDIGTGDNEIRSTGSTTPSLEADDISEAEALEELLRMETLRHLEAAWKAERRLVQACLKKQNLDQTKDAQDNVETSEAITKQAATGESVPIQASGDAPP